MSELDKQAARWTANGLSVGRGLAGPWLAHKLNEVPPSERDWGLTAKVAGIVATDKIDGFLGRYAEVSALGGWLDQMSDKAFVLPPMYVLAKNGEISDYHWQVKLGRDIGVTALRSMVQLNGGNTTADDLGKMKALTEMTGLVVASSPLADRYPDLSNRIFDASSTLNIVSGAHYMHAFGEFTLSVMRGENQEQAADNLLHNIYI